MRVLGIDPGASDFTWSLMEPADDQWARARFVASGSAPVRCYGVEDLLERPEMGSSLVVAIERPGGFLASKARVDALLNTAYAAGFISAIAMKAPNVSRVLEWPMQIWRPRLVGRPRHRGQFAGTAGDKEVARVLGLVVENMPKRSNEHARDAMGLAVVVGRAVAIQLREVERKFGT